MGYKENAFFEPPPAEAVLWRYMDFTKFASLLDRSALFFARADKLGDPFEGSYSQMNKELRPTLYSDSIPDHTIRNFTNFMKETRRFTYVNCWHWSRYESAAMWSLYSRERDGIAVKTDFQALSQSLVGSHDVHIGKIKYVHYDETFIPENSTVGPYLYKRKSFEHETEVRAIIQDIPMNDGGLDLSRDAHAVGTYVDVRVSQLIKEVVVAPYAEDWFLDLVQSISQMYGMLAPVYRSALGEAPVWS